MVSMYQTFSEKRLYMHEESWKEVLPDLKDAVVYLEDNTWWLKRWIRPIGLMYLEQQSERQRLKQENVEALV